MSKEQDASYQPRATVIEHPPHNPAEGFDRRVHIMDAKTGKLIKYQPHTLHIVGGNEYYEFPVSSGNLFYRSGEKAGRWLKTENGWGAVTTAEHVEFATPLTEDQSIAALNEKNAALEAELAALKAERSEKKEEVQETQKGFLGQRK